MALSTLHVMLTKHFRMNALILDIKPSEAMKYQGTAHQQNIEHGQESKKHSKIPQGAGQDM
jgi:hypothetical protein